MKEILRKVFSLLTKTDSHPKRGKHKSKGQSLVELTLALPVILILFSGMVEFGFMLNYYLSLLDATRYSARYFSNGFPNPINTDGSDNMDFYAQAAGAVKGQLDPAYNDLVRSTRKVSLDSAEDDVIITVYRVSKDASGNASVETRPTSGVYHMYNNQTPVFTAASLQSQLVSGAPCEGILVVEVDYNYHQVLALPWLTPFLSDPVLLHAYTVMPLQVVEPVCH